MLPPAAVARCIRAVLAGVAFAACALAPLAPSQAAAAEAKETAVKAAYLYKFGLFVEWPSGAFPAADSPFTICIVGSDPFGATLDASVTGQKIGNHPIAVRRLTSISGNSGCQIAYFAHAEAVQVPKVLTITDSETGSETGSDQTGIISFVIKDSRVRFVIDDEAAAVDGLAIDARLLNLALAVKPRH